MDDGPDQSLSLAQGQAEHGSQCQRRGNRQIGVGGLPAGGGAWRGPPGRDRRVREPDCETATLAQGGVILGPVGHPVPLLGNVAATGCLGFERHDRDPSVRKGAVVLRRPAPDANRSIRATMSRFMSFGGVLDGSNRSSTGNRTHARQRTGVPGVWPLMGLLMTSAIAIY